MRQVTTLFVFCLAMLLAPQAAADPISFSGVFTNDKNVSTYVVVMDTPGNLWVSTSGWDGTLTGGIDSNLHLWAADGTLLISPETQVTAGDVEQWVWDSLLTADLDVGTYFVTLSLYYNPNTPANLKFGFDSYGDRWTRYDLNSGAYNISFENATTVTETPEPATMTLVLTGMAGAVWRRRRMRKLQ